MLDADNQVSNMLCIQIQRTRGMRCWVSGEICDAATSVVLATCEAQLVNLQQLWKAQAE